jgi:hypothetical protein
MVWTLPLLATSYDAEKGLRRVEVHDARRLRVLTVEYKYWIETRFSALGEITVARTDARDAVQRAEAIVLAIRECAESAWLIGIREYYAEALASMEPVIRLITGDTLKRAGSRFQARGSIRDLLTTLDELTESDGRLKSPDEARAQDAIDVMDGRIPPPDTTREAVRRGG